MTISPKKRWTGILILASLLVMMVTWWLLSRDTTLDKILAQDELVVLTRNAPTTYYFGKDSAEGPEHDLVEAFAEHLGVTVRFEVMNSVADILAALTRGEGHLAAAGLTRTEIRERRFLFGPPYQTIQQQVVCRRGETIPETPEQLTEIALTVIAGSSYLERLYELQSLYPELSWTVSEDLNTEEILANIWEKQIECTLADSNIVAINRRYYPELTIAFPIAEEQQLTWVFRPESLGLQAATNDWLQQFEKDGKLARIMHRYYGHAEIFDYVDTARYHRRIRKRLPQYEEMFKAAAEEYSLSWMLLAAQAYQESHWNVKARSPTGVRGIMMLTQRTARELGVKNRIDPKQSIPAGARYLANLLDRIPPSVNGPDRMKFALAAYNIGMGHLKDARELAQREAKNPDTWRSLREVFPLLAKKQYYKTLQYGYARGSEPVRYVDRIYNYRDILRQVKTASQPAEDVDVSL